VLQLVFDPATIFLLPEKVQLFIQKDLPFSCVGKVVPPDATSTEFFYRRVEVRKPFPWFSEPLPLPIKTVFPSRELCEISVALSYLNLPTFPYSPAPLESHPFLHSSESFWAVF